MQKVIKAHASVDTNHQLEHIIVLQRQRKLPVRTKNRAPECRTNKRMQPQVAKALPSTVPGVHERQPNRNVPPRLRHLRQGNRAQSPVPHTSARPRHRAANRPRRNMPPARRKSVHHQPAILPRRIVQRGHGHIPRGAARPEMCSSRKQTVVGISRTPPTCCFLGTQETLDSLNFNYPTPDETQPTGCHEIQNPNVGSTKQPSSGSKNTQHQIQASKEKENDHRHQTLKDQPSHPSI